jgi:hypothetical protein
MSIFEGLQESSGVNAQIKRREDIQTQIARNNTDSMVRKEMMAGGGQSAIQGERVLNQEDKIEIIKNAGLAAEAMALSGSIESSSNLINQAMSFFYQDRQLNNQNMIQQLNYFSGIAEGETKQLLDQETRKYEEDQKMVERVKDNVDTAVVSGVATTEELRQMTDPTLTDEERLTVAQGVVARRAQQEYNLDKAIKGREYEKLGLEIDSENAKILAAQQAAQSGVLTPEQNEVATDLRAELNNRQFYKDAQDLEANTGSLLIALAQEDGVSDISAINTFQRLVVDPGVAVREGDVALLQTAMSWTDRAWLETQGLWKGDQLTPAARSQMEDLVSKVYDARIAIVDENTAHIRTIAKEQGIDYGKYVGKKFATYNDIKTKINPEDAVTSGINATTDGYLDNIITTLSADPSANPFGVNLGN